jgi:hypothetical protein
VQTMNFAYDPGTDYTVLVGRYEEELGPPTDRLPDATQSAVWQDRQTRFEVFERGASVGSFMQDLAGGASAFRDIDPPRRHLGGWFSRSRIG